MSQQWFCSKSRHPMILKTVSRLLTQVLWSARRILNMKTYQKSIRYTQSILISYKCIVSIQKSKRTCLSTSRYQIIRATLTQRQKSYKMTRLRQTKSIFIKLVIIIISKTWTVVSTLLRNHSNLCWSTSLHHLKTMLRWD